VELVGEYIHFADQVYLGYAFLAGVEHIVEILVAPDESPIQLRDRRVRKHLFGSGSAGLDGIPALQCRWLP
jgi:hypothetical protein